MCFVNTNVIFYYYFLYFGTFIFNIITDIFGFTVAFHVLHLFCDPAFFPLGDLYV